MNKDQAVLAVEEILKGLEGAHQTVENGRDGFPAFDDVQDGDVVGERTGAVLEPRVGARRGCA